MISKTLKSGVTQLVADELRAANENYPLFASNHEAYAVIKEEMEEAEDELKEFKYHIGNLWNMTKENLNCTAQFNIMKRRAMLLAYEAIQLAAMCLKGCASESERSKREHEQE